MNYINMRFPGGVRKCLTLSYDDAVEEDIQLCELMKTHGVAGTFNINTGSYSPEGKTFQAGQFHRRMTLDMCKSTYLSSPLFEIATHGLTHPWLERLPPQQAVYEIIQDRRNIEEQYGVICRGHAYPYGTYNKNVIKILESCGIVYARTTKPTFGFDIPESWLELMPTCHHTAKELFELADSFTSAEESGKPMLFYLWGHTYEFERDDNWDIIERFLDKTADRADTWYATNIEVCDYVKAYNSLIYSADGMTVCNPTAIDIWLETRHGTTQVPAGRTVKLA